MQERHKARMLAAGFKPSGRKYQLTDEGREAIRQGQAARWAKWRAERRQADGD